MGPVLNLGSGERSEDQMEGSKTKEGAGCEISRDPPQMQIIHLLNEAVQGVRSGSAW
jgi:hypothetical protein